MNPALPEYVEAEALTQFLSSVAGNFQIRKAQCAMHAEIDADERLVMIVQMKPIEPKDKPTLRLRVYLEIRQVEEDDGGEAWKNA